MAEEVENALETANQEEVHSIDINLSSLDLETGFGVSQVSWPGHRELKYYSGDILLWSDFGEEKSKIRELLNKISRGSIEEEHAVLDPESETVGKIGVFAYADRDGELARIVYRQLDGGEAVFQEFNPDTGSLGEMSQETDPTVEFFMEYRDEETAKDFSFLAVGPEAGRIIDREVKEGWERRKDYRLRFETEDISQYLEELSGKIKSRLQGDIVEELEEQEDLMSRNLSSDFFYINIEQPTSNFHRDDLRSVEVSLFYDPRELESYEDPEDRVRDCYDHVLRVETVVENVIERFVDEGYEKGAEAN